MRQVSIEKITLNIGCGTAVPIENAKAVLERLSKRKIVITKTKKRTTFNVPKNKEIGCKVTIRKDANELLKSLLDAKDNRLQGRSFDATGNLSFGIKEYIDISGMDYDPKIGILGFDVCITLQRPGYRVKRKKLAKQIGRKHMLTKEDAMNFMKEKFGTTIEE